jgi:predicted nucleic acid-binding protein
MPAEQALATAPGGATDYLVSGDDDFLSLVGDPHLAALHIISVQEFLTLLPK